MKTIFRNKWNVEVMYLGAKEDWIGTKGITQKRGYWCYSPNQGESWTYLGKARPNEEWLERNYGRNEK